MTKCTSSRNRDRSLNWRLIRGKRRPANWSKVGYGSMKATSGKDNIIALSLVGLMTLSLPINNLV